MSEEKSGLIDVRVQRAMSANGLWLGVSDISISLMDRKLSKIYKIKFT